jgi:hypothetical protein
MIGASCPEKPSRSCNMSELVETSSISAMNTGRWLVKEKMMDRNYNTTFRSENSNKKYEAGLQSVGFTMDYVPTTCSLMALEDLMMAERLESCFQRGRRNSTRPLEIVMVGDSNFRYQTDDHLKHYFGKTLKIHQLFSFSYVRTDGKFEKIGEQIFTELNELAKQPNKDYVLLFNIGLHELTPVFLVVVVSTKSVDACCSVSIESCDQTLVETTTDTVPTVSLSFQGTVN